MKRFFIDGMKEVALKEPTADELDEGEERVPACSFEEAHAVASNDWRCNIASSLV
jgi:hypothetical protein